MKKSFFAFGPVILALGVAIGATTAVFTIMDVLVFHPLPIKDQDRVLSLGGLVFDVEGMDGLSWWGQARTLDHLATYFAGEAGLEGSLGIQWIRVTVVSPGFFSVFAIDPAGGRLITETDEQEDQRVAVISHAFWRAHYGTEVSSVGQQIRLNGVLHTVVGVAPEGFEFPNRTQAWVPRVRAQPTRSPLEIISQETSGEWQSPQGRWVGRLAPGTSLTQARSELNALLRRLNDSYSAKTGTLFGDFVSAAFLRERLARDYRPTTQALLWGAVLLLLVVSANCSVFLLGRLTARRREIAVRQALGASSGRILQQLLIEMLCFVFASGVLGIVASACFLVLSPRFLSLNWVALSQRSSIPWATFGTALFAATAVSFLACLIPALQCTSTRTLEALKDSAPHPANPSGRAARRSLIILEVSLTLALLIVGILSLRSFVNLRGLDIGYNPRNVLGVSLLFSQSDFNRDRFLARQRELLDAVRALPNVRFAGAVSELPVWGPRGGYGVRRGDMYKSCLSSLVAGNYFSAVGIQLHAGREFQETDRDAVILGESAARELWKGRSPLGEELWIDGEKRPRRVVGVAKDIRSLDISEEPALQLYLPYFAPFRDTLRTYSMNLVVRCASNCEESVSSLVQQFASSAGGPPPHILRLEDQVATAIRPVKARAQVLGMYALVGLGVALLGVYSVISYMTAFRNYEFGIRMAMGARPADVLLLVAREGLLLASLGIFIGTILSLYAARLLKGLVFGIKPLDPSTFVVASVVLLGGCLIATLIPAARAARCDPWETLKSG